MTRPGAAVGGEIVFATHNPGKLREVRALLAALRVRVLGLEELDPLALPEEGDDYAANAVAKARAAASASGRPALGDDSGLEVAALDGAPGVRSARYGPSDVARNERLLEALAGVQGAHRGARFVCVAALATPGGELATARGECAGRILAAPRGTGGFGYDPVFEPIEARGRSLAELPAEEKELLSHRGRAFRALLPAIEASLRA